jgi:drug/metabolite transporter (DMT)-like permease
MVIFGALFLKEKVSSKKWIAVAIGMAGVLVALRPGPDLFETGAMIVLVGTWLGALNRVFMRKLTETEHTLAITIYPNLLMLIVSAPLLVKHWTPVSPADAGIFAVVGILTAGAQYCVAQALRFAKVSTLGPLDYSSFVWVIGLDLFFWEVLPSAFTLLGSVIIIGSNLYLLYSTKTEKEEKTALAEISDP